MLDRMAMVCLQSGRRRNRFDGCGETVRVIRAGRGHLEATVFEALQQWRRIIPLLRRRFMGEQEAGMLILAHHHTVVGAQRVRAINRTRRPRKEGQQVLQRLLWGREVRANVIKLAFE
jgi:hypothetical protein